MAVSLGKRNLRVLSVTALLLLLVFFVVQNANSITFGEEQANIPTSGDKAGLTSAGTAVHNSGELEVNAETKNKGEESTKVNAEIAKIKQEVKNGASSPEDDSISRKGAKGSDASGNGANAEFDPAKEYTMILGHSPVIIFSKSYCPYSTRLKELLKQGYRFTPNYVVIELDMHNKGAALQKYIEKQTGRGTVPNLIINGKSRGGSDDIRALHNSGELLANLVEWSEGSYTVEKIEKPSNN
ncbi:hypothetical protein HG536_0G02930 [Torulaspora globosa]|uniref:Glutaredoxin domain-containing protein n=1 Tax=Torulaspora globosa TaxID=48254 RepID=A0A7G3ZLP5_9SACH|nr:uncharacterized protein HG536_0G02930 [Torulaspora globosa]QLL34431.1 hypothetical protein HG536_0G02930 [Torulaspora globosa]